MEFFLEKSYISRLNFVKSLKLHLKLTNIQLEQIMNELEKKTEDKIKDYLDMQVIYDTF
jgi:hypothetical protein